MGCSHKQGEGKGEGGRESSIPHVGMVEQGRNRVETCPTHSRPAPDSITRAYGWAQGFGPDPHRSRTGPCSRTCLFCDCYFIFFRVGVGLPIQETIPDCCLSPGPSCCFIFKKSVSFFATGTCSWFHTCPQMSTCGSRPDHFDSCRLLPASLT